MLVEEVRKLSNIDKFCYWIQERHLIHIRRQKGLPKPWTDDEVLQNNFFTNPYRENDKTTIWFRENIRGPLNKLKNDQNLIMATVIFRWFNYIPTGEKLKINRGWIKEYPPTGNPTDLVYSPLCKWNREKVVQLLDKYRQEGEKLFTGAFMINSPAGKPKLESVCERIDNVWKDRETLTKAVQSSNTLQKAHKAFMKYPGLAGFMAYELVSDLEHTYLLEKAVDRDTWCNPGPGAIRGFCRVFDRFFVKGNNSFSPPVPQDFQEGTKELLKILRKKLPNMPRFDMRTVEHSLCETDKYIRVLEGDGRAKRTYEGAY